MIDRNKIIGEIILGVHDEHGWLSDAQDAQLEVDEWGTVFFCGEGSIDVRHLVEIVLSAVEENK